MKPALCRMKNRLLLTALLTAGLLAGGCATQAEPVPRTPPPTPAPTTIQAGPNATPTSPRNEPETSPPQREVAVQQPVETVRKVSPDLLERRAEYDTTVEFAGLLKPHFLARTEKGELQEAAGAPDLVLEWQGQVKVRLKDGEDGAPSYVDLLALQSELVGEHPVHKIYRLEAMGIPIAPELRRQLSGEDSDRLFTSVDFEYQRRKNSAGVVTEVFPDGTLLVIPFELPREWRSRDDRIASPTHLHLNPRALSAGDSALAREYELEILSLPFEEQRYPAAPLARKKCDVYRESVNHPGYRALLDSLGYRFTPRHVLQAGDTSDAPFGRRLRTLLWGGAGNGLEYFGFEGGWIADLLRGQQATWLGECDTAGGIRAYRKGSNDQESYYLTIRRSLDPDKKQRYKILLLDDHGAAEEIYTAPGIILMAQPLPSDSRTWLLSTEGWPAAKDGQPADPRWQTVYAVNLDDPEQYQKVRYPVAQFPQGPEAGLYGVSPRLTEDGNYLFNTLYGFRDEGGGIWVVNLTNPDFANDPSAFARIVSWDHTLSWTLLPGPAGESSQMHVFMTGKEVADDFAMTANILRIKEAGLDSAIEREERLLQMVGWNPVPFGWQRLSDTQYRVLVETHYNYESSLLPRAKGVYVIPVGLSAD